MTHWLLMSSSIQSVCSFRCANGSFYSSCPVFPIPEFDYSGNDTLQGGGCFLTLLSLLKYSRQQGRVLDCIFALIHPELVFAVVNQPNE
jgi:hypothetical protein